MRRREPWWFYVLAAVCVAAVFALGLGAEWLRAKIFWAAAP